MFNNVVWGSLLIVLGVSFLAKSFFNIAFPLFRIFAGGMLIYAGISLMTTISTSSFRNSQTITFAKQTINELPSSGTYTTIFGEGIIDLSTIEQPKDYTKIHINTLCGINNLKLNVALPTKININAAFSSTQLPDDTFITFGKYTYNTVKNSKKPFLEIDVNVVFGSLFVQTS